jgi:hypothetical protein
LAFRAGRFLAETILRAIFTAADKKISPAAFGGSLLSALKAH